MATNSHQIAERTEELLLYIAQQSANDPAFNLLKLNKILFAIDFLAYGVWGHPLTTFRYFREQHGPTPEPAQFIPIRDTLIREQRARLETRFHFGKDKQQLIALKQPDMSTFSTEESKLIDDVIGEFRAFNESELTRWTHGLQPWLNAADGEELPFFIAFVLDKHPADKSSLNWAVNLIRELQGESGDVKRRR